MSTSLAVGVWHFAFAASAIASQLMLAPLVIRGNATIIRCITKSQLFFHFILFYVLTLVNAWPILLL